MDVIPKEELLKTIPLYHQKWQLRALGATEVKAVSIPRMCIMNSRLYKYRGVRHIFIGAGPRALTMDTG